MCTENKFKKTNRAKMILDTNITFKSVSDNAVNTNTTY